MAAVMQEKSVSNQPYGHSDTRASRAPWLVKMTSPVHFALALGLGAWLQDALELPCPLPRRWHGSNWLAAASPVLAWRWR